MTSKRKNTLSQDKVLEEKVKAYYEGVRQLCKSFKINVDFFMDKYLKDEENRQILKALEQKNYDIRKLHELMKNFIEIQLQIQTSFPQPLECVAEYIQENYYDNEKNEVFKPMEYYPNVCILQDFAHIPNPITKELNYPSENYLHYLRSKEFINRIVVLKEPITKISDYFVEYLVKNNITKEKESKTSFYNNLKVKELLEQLQAKKTA